MPSNRVLRVPSYRRHKPTGQAVVTLNGKDHYLGRWNTVASRAVYDRLIGEWLAAGRELPKAETDLTIAELALRYLKYAKTYYRKDGRLTGSIQIIKVALRILKESYGPTPVVEFGPLALESLQVRLAKSERGRITINGIVGVIKRVFRWAVTKQLIPVGIYQALAAVPGLKKGRTEAHESQPILPVDDLHIDATLPHLPAVIANMIRFQRLTGCRPGEVCSIRPCDVDTSGEVWKYRPQSHKTEHHHKARVIFIGPKAQNVLRPYLLRDKTSYCFVPRESQKKQNALRRENRQTPMTPSQARRRPKRRPKRSPGDRYAIEAYNRAIARAVMLANEKRKPEEGIIPTWSPNQLRHASATEIRRMYGIEAASTVLGHANLQVSEIYAEKNFELAAAIMQKIG
jgi:integrase